jgi:pantothenate kinase-related protein Tda10
MKRALTIKNLMDKKHETMTLSGQWNEAFGEVEKYGVWFVWGASGSGKSTFAMQLCEELCNHGKVLYNSLEEGAGLTFQERLKRVDTKSMSRRFCAVCEDMETLKKRLKKRRSADFIVIDSYQYSELTYPQYIKFKESFSTKLFIFISHADGRRPAGRSAKSVMFDANLKIWVEGFRAFSNGRFIGANGGTYNIWKEGAWKFWGEV